MPIILVQVAPQWLVLDRSRDELTRHQLMEFHWCSMRSKPCRKGFKPGTPPGTDARFGDSSPNPASLPLFGNWHLKWGRWPRSGQSARQTETPQSPSRTLLSPQTDDIFLGDTPDLPARAFRRRKFPLLGTTPDPVSDLRNAPAPNGGLGQPNCPRSQIRRKLVWDDYTVKPNVKLYLRWLRTGLCSPLRSAFFTFREMGLGEVPPDPLAKTSLPLSCWTSQVRWSA